MAETKYAAFPQATTDWLATLSPEELAAFDASVELGNQEMMADVQRKLPERLRFDGEFGLPSALGYGKDADSRAQIRNFFYEGMPPILGSYRQSARGLGVTPEYYEREKRAGRTIDRLREDPLVEYISDRPDYDQVTGAEGVSVYTPDFLDSFSNAYIGDKGYEERASGGRLHTQAGTIAHELTHKFFDSPAFLDFLEETGRNEGKPLTGEGDHRYIESVEPYAEFPRYAEKPEASAIRALVQDEYRELLDDFEQWLTPEKQEKYGLRLPVKATKPMADGGPVLADRNPLLPNDPLFIQDDLGYSPEVLSDMQAADVTFDPSLYPPLPPEEPNMIDFAKDRLIDVGQGFADIPEFVANYFVQPDEQGQPSFISPQEFGQDVKNVGMAMGQAIADDPVGFALDITPGISNVRAGMEANRLYEQANVQEAQGDELGAAKTRSMASLTTTDMLNPVPTAFAYKAIFAGPMAQKAPQKLSDKRLDKLEITSDDTLAQEVFEDTNAFIGLNGKRQFEIDTSDANVDMSWLQHMYQYYSPDQLPRGLPEILDFPELYENYPQLQEIKVGLDLSMDAEAAYFPRLKTIKFNLNKLEPNNKTMTSALLHETQHAVQDIEGDLLQGSYPDEKLTFSQYERLPIEVDARNVQKRFEFPEEKSQPPKFTQDYSQDDLMDVPRLRELSYDANDLTQANKIVDLESKIRAINLDFADQKRNLVNKYIEAGEISPSDARKELLELEVEYDRLLNSFKSFPVKSKRPPIQYDLPFDAQNKPQTTRPVPRNPLDQSRSDPYESPADTRDRQRRRQKRGYAEGGIVSLANGGPVEHGIVTL